MSTNTTLDNVMKSIGGAILFAPPLFALIAASVVWRGYVMAVLWGWFMVPPFGLPSLSIPFAIGISIVAGVFAGHRTEEKGTPFWTLVGRSFMGPLMSLGIGAIVLKFL